MVGFCCSTEEEAHAYPIQDQCENSDPVMECIVLRLIESVGVLSLYEYICVRTESLAPTRITTSLQNTVFVQRGMRNARCKGKRKDALLSCKVAFGCDEYKQV